MEQFSAWVTIFIGVVIPFVGWIFNSLITNKINELNRKNDELQLELKQTREDFENRQKEDRNLVFSRLDVVKDAYVRKDLYEQATKFHTEHNDEKFKSLLTIMTTQFTNVENKIEDLKKLINEKLNDKQHGG